MDDLCERSEKSARHMVSIAIASQRPNGADIPLGAQCREAADIMLQQEARIRQLEAQLATAREALEKVCTEAWVSLSDLPPHNYPNGWRKVATDRVDIARQALAELDKPNG